MKNILKEISEGLMSALKVVIVLLGIAAGFGLFFGVVFSAFEAVRRIVMP